MAKFSFYQDVLVKIWTRNFIEVDADTREDAIKILKENCDRDLGCDDADNIHFSTCENLYETEETIPKEENNGKPTIEIYDDETCELVVTN